MVIFLSMYLFCQYKERDLYLGKKRQYVASNLVCLQLVLKIKRLWHYDIKDFKGKEGPRLFLNRTKPNSLNRRPCGNPSNDLFKAFKHEDTLRVTFRSGPKRI